MSEAELALAPARFSNAFLVPPVEDVPVTSIVTTDPAGKESRALCRALATFVTPDPEVFVAVLKDIWPGI